MLQRASSGSADMVFNRSIDFFERQFERQVRQREFGLNPFEQAALSHLHGRVLDLGCGVGNLALAAARQGCSVLALDASATGIAHLRASASSEGLAIDARQGDLMHYRIEREFDAMVSIGLLMFFDCPNALRSLADIQSHVREGGIAIDGLTQRIGIHVSRCGFRHRAPAAARAAAAAWAGRRRPARHRGPAPAGSARRARPHSRVRRGH